MENKKELLKALAGFIDEVPVIFKGTTGYGYKYADLTTIFKVIKPLLKVHGLGFTQLVNENSIDTVIFHIETGQSIESKTPIIEGVKLKGMNDFQVLGSQITYLRRYALSSILGLVTDADTDAAGEQESTKKTLPKLPKGVFNDVVDYLNGGGKLETVRLKYDIDAEMESKLLDAVL